MSRPYILPGCEAAKLPAGTGIIDHEDHAEPYLWMITELDDIDYRYDLRVEIPADRDDVSYSTNPDEGGVRWADPDREQNVIVVPPELCDAARMAIALTGIEEYIRACTDHD